MARPSHRIIAVATAVALVLVLLPLTLASPAYAASCVDGDRTRAKQLADSGQYRVPVAPVYSENKAKIELRYATDGSRCVWALISQAQYQSKVWIDRSYDGGRTWVGLLGAQLVQWGNNSTYTGTFNDANVVARACGYQNLGYWYFDPAIGAHRWVDRPGRTACTAWW